MTTDRSNHDEYGKELLRSILGARWITRFDDRGCIEMEGGRADLDGIILSEDLSRVECAVEIEARVYKQIRGAIFDLAQHPAPRKLFVVILAQPQLGNAGKARRHCSFVWERLTHADRVPFALVVLQGSGENPLTEADRVLLMESLRQLELIH